ncbi:MAG TPA: J domain-containing protein [Actinomycetota bacterium]|nr:J domain-containing protein [Actinomycetota bacterium]
MNPHEILGTRQGATAAEVRAAYRRMARIYHADGLESSTDSIRREAESRMVELDAARDALLEEAASAEREKARGPEFSRRSELIRPSVSGSVLTGTEAPARPPRSPLRMVVYGVIFVCLVALSWLYTQVIRPSPTKAVTPAATGGVIHPASPAATPSAPPAGPIIESDFAKQSCSRGDVLPAAFSLRAAFETTAGTAAAWEDALAQGQSTSPLHELAPGMKVAVCYIDGPWQAPQNVVDFYNQLGAVVDRAITIVPETGAPDTAPYGPHESLPILRPASPAPSPHG